MTARHSAAGAALVAGAFLMLGCSDSSAPILGAQTTPPLASAHHEHTMLRGDDLNWGPAPPIFPPGAQMAVLQGDPSVAGAIFTVRLRFPGGYVLPAHFHPTDEAVTVISGTFFVGLGDKFSEKALLPALKPGDFIIAPANANHFATVRGQTVVQVHAIGPFQMTFVNPEDTPAT